MVDGWDYHERNSTLEILNEGENQDNSLDHAQGNGQTSTKTKVRMPSFLNTSSVVCLTSCMRIMTLQGRIFIFIFQHTHTMNHLLRRGIGASRQWGYCQFLSAQHKRIMIRNSQYVCIDVRCLFTNPDLCLRAHGGVIQCLCLVGEPIAYFATFCFICLIGREAWLVYLEFVSFQLLLLR